MKKSIIIFVTAAVLSVGVTTYGWAFVNSQIGQATLSEETITGNRDEADGLMVGFRADSANNLHWFNSFDYSGDKTDSSFKRGEMTKEVDSPVYDEIRFTGWSTVPFCTQLSYGSLEGLQEKGIQVFYNQVQQRVVESNLKEEGKIRLKDYLDFYPVSFQFRFGTKLYSSENALTGLKVYDERNILSSETGTDWDEDVELYAAFNNMFKIPVIENEYQEYKVSKVENYNAKTALGYKTDIEKPLGEGEDFYEFDPIIVIQEENIIDGKEYAAEDGSENTLKNRMLFIVNNRTAKGERVDVSQIGDGYGVYELPIEVTATATIRKGSRSKTVPDPNPKTDEMKMVFPLDEEAEYVEMSLSDDHRYLAVFSVKDGDYYVEMIDADNWTSQGEMKVFPESEKMTYTWGEDGSLAMTNHEDYVAVLSRTGNKQSPYEILYSGRTEKDLDVAFFDTEMVVKKNSIARYQYGIDTGLSVAVKDGKAALVQNLLVDDAQLNIRNAALGCAIIDDSGVIYRGKLKSNIVDLEYDMSDDETQNLKEYLKGEGDSKVVENMILPVSNENWCTWE